MAIIKAGYRITVKSWENDGDNNKTAHIDGQTEEQMKFLVDFVKLFSSKNNHRGNPGIGNYYEPDNDEIIEANQRVRVVVEAHKDMLKNNIELGQYFLTDGEYDSDGWSEFAYELELCGGDFWTRVMDSFKVEYIPHEIVLEDVTDKFK